MVPLPQPCNTATGRVFPRAARLDERQGQDDGPLDGRQHASRRIQHKVDVSVYQLQLVERCTVLVNTESQ